MKLKDIKTSALKLIDEFSATASGYTDDEDIRAKIAPIVNLVAREIALVRPIIKTKEYFLPSNYISASTPPEEKIAYSGDVFSLRGKARAYYFETDGAATVEFVSVNGETLLTVTTSGAEIKKGYVGGGVEVEMRFGGDSAYTFKNACLYRATFDVLASDTSKIPDYSCLKSLPDDFSSMICVRGGDYSFIGSSLLVYPSSSAMTLVYTALPPFIDASSSDELEIQLDEEAQSALVYGVAADLLKADGAADYRIFETKYQTLLASMGERNRMKIGVRSNF